jgi:ABC transporter substrate binding protein
VALPRGLKSFSVNLNGQSLDCWHILPLAHHGKFPSSQHSCKVCTTADTSKAKLLIWCTDPRKVEPIASRRRRQSWFHSVHPGNPIAGPLAKFIEGAGGPVALDVKTERVHDATDIEAAIVTAAQQPGSGLIIFPDSLTTIHRALIIGLAARHKLPAVYPFRIFPADGGLMSYGLDFAETFRQAATYVDRILRGEKPADLPVQAPNKFDLVINLKTAKSLGLAIPLTLQASADEVIE